MADLSIRNLDEDVKRRLRVRAAEHGRSMEAEVREILNAALPPSDPPANPFYFLMQRFAAIGGVELDLPARIEPPRSARFDK